MRKRLGKEGLEETGNILWEDGGFFAGIDSVGPVVLAAERHPMELAFERLLDGQRFVD